VESQIHILQCKACEHRAKIRDEYIKKFVKHFEDHRINETTTRVVIANVRAWVNQTRQPTMQNLAPNASNLLVAAVREQNRLGWYQWFKGRISYKWAELYLQDMMVNQEQRHHNTVIKWGGRIISMTYIFVLDAWQTQNDIEHGMDGDPIQTKKEKMIRQIIWKRNKLVYVPNNYLRNLNEEQ
jgi:hypothetical protein